MCKAILTDEKNRKAAHRSNSTSSANSNKIIATVSIQDATGGVPLEIVARCARDAFATVRSACDDGRGGCDAARAVLAAQLVEAEALPQAGRWHRRDLAPGLAAAWNAVLRALRRAAPSLAANGCRVD